MQVDVSVADVDVSGGKHRHDMRHFCSTSLEWPLSILNQRPAQIYQSTHMMGLIILFVRAIALLNKCNSEMIVTMTTRVSTCINQEQTVTMTTRDPTCINQEIKYKLRRKNRLMHAGRVEEAGARSLKGLGKTLRGTAS